MEIITTSIFHLEFKENIENDIAVHGICFDFYYQPKLSQIGQDGSVAAADACLADSSGQIASEIYWSLVIQKKEWYIKNILTSLWLAQL